MRGGDSENHGLKKGAATGERDGVGEERRKREGEGRRRKGRQSEERRATTRMMA